ncbi:hypothetical protein V9T40_009056 [Parthenolecanium corni]|uniref:Endonuclease/exonuclease/phosphatase domain-containing protein n=1 Tax=Parthenolecanium corni TaxID=536013 RepID=A0AAN9TRU2_9HEMI
MITSYRDVVANARKPKGWLDERAKNGTVIKVVSYNILAQSLLHAHPELYSECNKDYLTWSYRSFLLINELNRFNADILCLQEVEADQLEFFNTQLGEFGYKGVFKKRTNEKDDGCAIFYKMDKFNLRECISVEYYQPNINLLNRDNIGIVMRLSPKINNNQCIVVATTHLLFNPKRHDIKLAQMQMLLAEIDRVAFKSISDSNEPSYYPIILTGDFNLKPYSLVYNLVVNGTVDNISQCYQNYQFRSPNRPLIPVRLGITDGCQHYHVMKNRHLNRTEISDFQYVKLFNTDRRSLNATDDNFKLSQNSPLEYDRFGSGSLYHNLKLSSAYPHSDISGGGATTYQDEWCTVDYIFYGPSQKVDDDPANPVDGDLKLVSYLKLPDCDQATCLGRLPNEVCPSDHLPLSATFHLPLQVETPSEMTCKF